MKKTLSAGTLGVSWGPSVKCCSNLQQTPPYFSFLKHFFRVAKFVTVMLRGALTRLRWRGGTGTWWLEEDPLHICQQLCSWTRCLSVPEFTSKAVEMNERFQRLTDYHRVQLDHEGASPLHTPFSCCFFCFLWSCHTDFEEYFLRLYRQPSKMQRPPFQKKTIATSSSSQIALWLEGPLKWHYMCCYAMWCSYNCTCAWEQKQHLISSDSINFLTPCCL